MYFELLQSGKKKHNGYWRTEIFDFVLRRRQQQPNEMEYAEFLLNFRFVQYSVRTLSCWLPLPGGYEFADADVTQSIEDEIYIS